MITTPQQPMVHGSVPTPEVGTRSKGSKTRRRVTKALTIAGGAVVALLALGWVGLHIQPAPFAAIPRPAAPPETMPIPAGLPAPVERYYRVTYGDRVPVITSGVLSGRGTLRLFHITFPLRFRFIHAADRSFRAYFELSIFGLPLMKIDEHYVDGKFVAERGPFGVEANEPKTGDHGAALRMWGEWVSWLPAMLLTDRDVRWEPVDDTTALLVVPVGAAQERAIVRFDPVTGKVQYYEAMKYKYPADTTKTLWVNAVWFGDTPWATFNIEDAVYNVPVDTSLKAKGP